MQNNSAIIRTQMQWNITALKVSLYTASILASFLLLSVIPACSITAVATIIFYRYIHYKVPVKQEPPKELTNPETTLPTKQVVTTDNVAQRMIYGKLPEPDELNLSNVDLTGKKQADASTTTSSRRESTHLNLKQLPPVPQSPLQTASTSDQSPPNSTPSNLAKPIYSQTTKLPAVPESPFAHVDLSGGADSKHTSNNANPLPIPEKNKPTAHLPVPENSLLNVYNSQAGENSAISEDWVSQQNIQTEKPDKFVDVFPNKTHETDHPEARANDSTISSEAEWMSQSGIDRINNGSFVDVTSTPCSGKSDPKDKDGIPTPDLSLNDSLGNLKIGCQSTPFSTNNEPVNLNPINIVEQTVDVLKEGEWPSNIDNLSSYEDSKVADN
jgi:hypothetical protein